MQNADCLARTKGTEHLFEKTNKRDTPSYKKVAGGYIILGANDKKEIIGIKEELIDKIKLANLNVNKRHIWMDMSD